MHGHASNFTETEQSWLQCNRNSLKFKSTKPKNPKFKNPFSLNELDSNLVAL